MRQYARWGSHSSSIRRTAFVARRAPCSNEMQWNKDAIELQLAHMERDETRESYNSATLLPVRRQMMQAWADYLEGLRVNRDF